MKNLSVDTALPRSGFIIRVRIYLEPIYRRFWENYLRFEWNLYRSIQNLFVIIFEFCAILTQRASITLSVGADPQRVELEDTKTVRGLRSFDSASWTSVTVGTCLEVTWVRVVPIQKKTLFYVKLPVESRNDIVFWIWEIVIEILIGIFGGSHQVCRILSQKVYSCGTAIQGRLSPFGRNDYHWKGCKRIFYSSLNSF